MGTGDKVPPVAHAPVADAVAWATSFPTHPLVDAGRKGADTGQARKPATLADELAQARDALAVMTFDLMMVDRELAPARAAETAIKDRLRQTWDVDSTGVIIIDFVRRNERSVLFRELDDLTAACGPKRVERARLNGEVKSLERLVGHITKQLEREARKQRKA